MQAELRVAGGCKLLKIWVSTWLVKLSSVKATPSCCCAPACMALRSAMSGWAFTLARCRDDVVIAFQELTRPNYWAFCWSFCLHTMPWGTAVTTTFTSEPLTLYCPCNAGHGRGKGAAVSTAIVDRLRRRLRSNGYRAHLTVQVRHPWYAEQCCVH